MPYGKKTLSSVVSCNVSYKDEISAEILIGILSGARSTDGWEAHMETFFNELPAPFIQGVMEENALSMTQLVAVFDTIPPIFQDRNFREMIHG